MKIISYSLALLFALTCCSGLPAQGDAEDQAKDKSNDDVEVLFDGTSMDKWRGYKQEEIGKGWKIEKDVLVFDGSGGGDICTKDAYKNFELSFKWKVSEGANSGIMYRVTMGDGAPYLSGIEYQILDDDKHPDGKNESTSAAALYALYKCENKELAKVGDWNTGKIIQNGNKVEHWLNGKKVVSVEIGDEEWNKRVAASKFKDWKKFGKSPEGHVALQDHGNKVWFKEITIKNLDVDEK